MKGGAWCIMRDAKFGIQLAIVNRTSGIEFWPNPYSKMAALIDFIADSALI